MKTKSLEDLTTRIEQVIQEHIAASHAAASIALERAFESGVRTRVAPAQQRRSSQNRRRRPPEEIAAAGQRLYEAICAKPGETMAVLASDTGMTPRELQLPLAGLKRSGQVRSVGKRHLTRYFPLVENAAAAG
jgi:hypothetical protein